MTAASHQRVSEKELLALLNDRRKAFQSSYFEFFKFFWHTINPDTNLKLNWHHEFLCNELQIVGEWVIKSEDKEYDLLINISPGETKSILATVMLHPWIWTNRPGARFIYGSHGDSLARFHAGLAKDLVMSEEYKMLFGDLVQIRGDVEGKGMYMNTAGGFRMTTSAGAKSTGFHAHLLGWDDPIDPKGAKSKAEIEKANNWIFQTLISRKTEKSQTPMIGIMQRLGTEDPSGTWLKKAEEEGLKLKHICLPATDEFPIKPADQVINYRGEKITIREAYERGGGFMNPIRTGPDVLAEQTAALGAREAAGQYGQQPRALKGNIIQREWCHIIPMHKVPPAVLKKSSDFVVDTAYGGSDEACPSAIMEYVEHGGYGFILGYWEFNSTFGKLVKNLHDIIAAKGNTRSRAYFEPKASGKSTVQIIKNPSLMKAWGLNFLINAMEWKMTEGDKVTRLNNVSPYLEAGRVFFVNGVWVEDYIEQIISFPNGERTEPADLLVMACVNMFERKIAQGYGATTA